MKREWLDMLGEAFASEIDAALNKGIDVYQTRKLKLAERLVEEGYLKPREIKLGGRFPVTIRGYALSDLGRLTYCVSCDSGQGETP